METQRLVAHSSALEHLKADPVMAQLMDRVGPIQLQPSRLSPFQSLTQAIIHQQLSGKAAGTILSRFLELFRPDAFPSPQEVLALSYEQLRGAGLSRAKVSYILDLAQRANQALVPTLEECDRMNDEKLIEQLTEIKGVGRWTVEMLLIFNLSRPDVLPVHDLGVRRGFQIAYRKHSMPKPEKLLQFGRRWAPYRTTATCYLWRAADFLE